MKNKTFFHILFTGFIGLAAGAWQTAAAQPAVVPSDADVRHCLNAVDSEAHDLAIALCGRALKKDGLEPQDRVAVLNGRGMGFSANGDLGNAHTAFSEALKIDPQSWTALVRRGYIHSRTDRRELALLDYGRAIDVVPREPIARALRGELLVRVGEHDAGIADLDIATRLAPDDVDAWLWRGIAHARKRRFDLACADIDRAFELAPDNPEVLNARVLLLARRGGFGTAAATTPR